ncbi:hypothetical protein ACWEVD_15615 [Nocardia thailandica]
MPATSPEPILPIPSDLHEQTWAAAEALQRVRRQISELEQQYRELGHSPESLRVDNLGDPIDPATATSATQMWLASTGRALQAADDGLRRATSYTTRLSLTEQACDERDQRIADRQAAFNRRRDIRRVR